MKAVCEALGLARSNVQRLRARSGDWTDARTCRTARADDALHIDYHVEIEGHHYSVSHALVGLKLEARITDALEEVLHRG